MLPLRRDAQSFFGPRQGHVEHAPLLLDTRFRSGHSAVGQDVLHHVEEDDAFVFVSLAPVNRSNGNAVAVWRCVFQHFCRLRVTARFRIALRMSFTARFRITSRLRPGSTERKAGHPVHPVHPVRSGFGGHGSQVRIHECALAGMPGGYLADRIDRFHVGCGHALPTVLLLPPVVRAKTRLIQYFIQKFNWRPVWRRIDTAQDVDTIPVGFHVRDHLAGQTVRSVEEPVAE